MMKTNVMIWMGVALATVTMAQEPKVEPEVVLMTTSFKSTFERAKSSIHSPVVSVTADGSAITSLMTRSPGAGPVMARTVPLSMQVPAIASGLHWGFATPGVPALLPK